MLTIGLLFWILFIVGIIFTGVGAVRDRNYDVPSLLFWVLIFLLGVGTFGSPMK